MKVVLCSRCQASVADWRVHSRGTVESSVSMLSAEDIAAIPLFSGLLHADHEQSRRLPRTSTCAPASTRCTRARSGRSSR